MTFENLINAETYHRNFEDAAKNVKLALDLCRTIPGRDEDELAEIEAEIGRLNAEAADRDLAFWRGNQAKELFTALERLHERISREARRQ